MFGRFLFITTCVISQFVVGWARADQRAILELRFNDVRKDEVPVWLRDGEVLVRESDLKSGGLNELGRSREIIGGHSHVPLSSLSPKVSFIVDDVNLRLNLTVNPALLGYHVE